jgi:hypothetical protein
MRRHLAALLFALAAGTAHGASDVPDDVVASTFARPAPGALILLLVDKAQAAPLDRAGTMLEAQLKRQLAAAGYRTATIDEADYQAVEDSEAAALGEHPKGRLIPASGLAKARALSRLAQIAKAESHCDMLIRARIILRKARLDAQYAEWDGRRRGILFEGIPDLGRSRVISAGLAGTTNALSVELVGVDGSGTRDFITHGGVVVPLIWNLERKSSSVRTDLFQDDTDVADGLQVALAPMREPR